jgi:O-antigen/teichoic acid export membrane protein
MMMGSSYFDLLTSLIQTVIVMRLIGPTGRGLMTISDLFTKWLANTHLGAMHGLSRRLPVALARHEEQRAQDLEDVGMSFVLATSILSALGMLGTAVFCLSWGTVTREVIACGAGIFLCSQTVTVYRVVLRAWGTFSVLALSSMVMNVAQLVLVVAGAWAYGVVGAMVGLLAANLLQLGYLHWAGRLRIRVRYNWPLIFALISSGLPLVAITYADILLRTVDRAMVGKLMGAHALGLYWPASQLAMYLFRIPESVGFVLMPRIWEKYGVEDDAAALRQHVLAPTMAAATVMPVLSGLLFIMIPQVLRALVPLYVEGTYAAQVLAMGGAFLALPIAACGLLVAMRREWLVTLTKLAGAAVIAGGAWWTLRHSGDLAHVAMYAVSGFALASLLALVAALGNYYRSRWRLALEIIICHVPFVWSILAIRGAGLLSDLLPVSLHEHSWRIMTMRMVIFLVLCLPVLWYGDRRTGVLRRTRALVMGKLAARVRPAEPPEMRE